MRRLRYITDSHECVEVGGRVVTAEDFRKFYRMRK